MSASNRSALPAKTSLSLQRIIGLALIVVGLTASITSGVAALQGQSGRAWQLGGLGALALLGWALFGYRHPKSFAAAGVVIGASWVLIGVLIDASNHLNGPFVTAAGVLVCVAAVVGSAVWAYRSRAVAR